MADGDGDGNGRWQGRWQERWLTAMQQRWWQQWLMATAMAMANGNGNSDERLVRQWQQQWQWSWQQQWRWQLRWQWRRPRQGQPLQRKGCLFMWQQCAVLLERRHLASTPMDKKVKCMHHGGDTAKNVCSPLRGRVPESSPWIVFCLFFTTTVQLTEQPSVCPLALFRCSRTLSAN